MWGREEVQLRKDRGGWGREADGQTRIPKQKHRVSCNVVLWFKYEMCPSIPAHVLGDPQLMALFGEAVEILASGTEMEKVGHWGTGTWGVSCPQPLPISLCFLCIMKWRRSFTISSNHRVQSGLNQGTMKWPLWNCEPNRSFLPLSCLCQGCRKGDNLDYSIEDVKNRTEDGPGKRSSVASNEQDMLNSLLRSRHQVFEGVYVLGFLLPWAWQLL